LVSHRGRWEDNFKWFLQIKMGGYELDSNGSEYAPVIFHKR